MKIKIPFFLIFIFIGYLTFFPGQIPQDPIERARAVHQKILTVDTHCDTPLHMDDESWDVGDPHEPGEKGSGCIDLPRMKAGGLDAEFFAAYVGQKPRTAGNYIKARDRVDKLIHSVKIMCTAYPDLIAVAMSPDDAIRNAERGLLSAYLSIENGFAIGKDLSGLRRYYDMGVRAITLCHSYHNDICDSSTDPNGPEHGGLSEFGRRVVREMNKLGMIIDVSHASDESFYEVLDLSAAPVMASHSCARALRNHPRNISDDMLKRLALNGGVIQICFLSDYLRKIKANPDRDKAMNTLDEKYNKIANPYDRAIRARYRSEYEDIKRKFPEEKASVKDIVDHIDHVVRLIGIDYVGIGTDFDGGGGVMDCEEVSQMPNITIELMKRGYDEQEIAKIWGGNFMRVFRQVEQVAAE